jgi:anti-sigma factor RsiW
MNDQWTNRLSEYIDGELDNEESVALEAHLATCGSCYATLAELRQVVARAQSLEDSSPSTDLWPDIRARLTPGRRPVVARARRFSFSTPQLLAASIVLALLSAGGMWIGLRSTKPTVTANQNVTSPPPDYTLVSAGRWRTSTDAAVTELEDALARNQGQLDTATVRVLRQSLAVIDRAIAQGQRALKRDPGSNYLNLHLANTMRQKIELLRRANALASQS